MRIKFFKYLTLFLLLVLASSCTRSRGFHRDSQYFEVSKSQESADSEDKTSNIEKFGAPKKRIYILPFYNATPFDKRADGTSRSDDLGTFAASELARTINASGKGLVPENILATIHSRDYYSGDKVRVQSLIKEARKLNVTIAIIGRINRIRYRQKGDPMGLLRKHYSKALVDMEIRVFDVVEGRELFNDSKIAEGTSTKLDIFNRDADPSDTADLRKELIQDALSNGASLFAKSVGKSLEKVAWEGRIAKIQGPYIYINSGKSSGLNLGDILKVVAPGEDIFDPVTGAMMGKTKGQVKGTLEIVDYMGNDGAITKIHSGGGFQEQDAVQLY